MHPRKETWGDSNDLTTEIRSALDVSGAQIQLFARAREKLIRFTDLYLSNNDCDADLHIEQNLDVGRTTAACAADLWAALT